jgi:hypothetical protein
MQLVREPTCTRASPSAATAPCTLEWSLRKCPGPQTPAPAARRARHARLAARGPAARRYPARSAARSLQHASGSGMLGSSCALTVQGCTREGCVGRVWKVTIGRGDGGGGRGENSRCPTMTFDGRFHAGTRIWPKRSTSVAISKTFKTFPANLIATLGHVTLVSYFTAMKGSSLLLKGRPGRPVILYSTRVQGERQRRRHIGSIHTHLFPATQVRYRRYSRFTPKNGTEHDRSLLHSDTF